MAHNVTDQDFDEVVINGSNSQPVLVDFWAEWCPPCKMLTPIIEQIGKEKSDVLTVVKLDTDANPKISERYSIMSIPTMLLFKDGKIVKQMVGYQNKDKIWSQISEHLATQAV